MIALITPTGARPKQFEMCSKWMKAQTFQGKVVWVIVDDAYPRTTDHVFPDFRAGWETVKVYPEPHWVNGVNTQGRNIAAGIQYLVNHYPKDEIQAVFIIEDDDYYRPVYLERMMANLKGYHIIGERNTIYYNVFFRRYVVNPNDKHASLFQTAFTLDVIPMLNECIVQKFIDYNLWARVANKHMFYENDLAIGMKGMPGRGGIGAGHGKAMYMRDDSHMNYINSKIGQDAKQYERYYRDYGRP